jgi:hypothetical protein
MIYAVNSTGRLTIFDDVPAIQTECHPAVLAELEVVIEPPILGPPNAGLTPFVIMRVKRCANC